MDNFNRSNGGIGSNWSGTTSGYSINGNKLDVGNGGDIYWNTNAFGASQEAYVKLATVDSSGEEQDLLLKSQSSSWSGDGVLEVWYDPVNHVAEVWTYTSSQDWVQHGSDISVSFSNGDVFGARATANGQVWKSYYFAGATRIAMRVQVNGVTDKVYYLLNDHLGSTTVSYRSDGFDTRFQYYKPWGELRPGPGTSLPTDRTYTGQRWSASIGLSFFNARWYDSSLGRFIQADTIIPGGVQGPDRFTALRNNPVKYTDPSGHDVCDEDGNCYNKQGWYRSTNAPRLNTVDTWKMMIWGKCGVTMSDEGEKWSTTSLHSVYTSLQNINNAVNNMLKSLIRGSTFYLLKQDTSAGDQYHGKTVGSTINFFTNGDVALRQINVYHEVGHLINNATDKAFENAVKNEDAPTWVGDDQKINPEALKGIYIHNDPNYTSEEARQTYSDFGPSEQWADAFANYVAGNIKLSDPDGPGTAMYNFVSGELAPNIGIP